jgi:hypothetical protein
MIEGGCYCRAIRYRIDGPIVQTAACHCRKCQYGSGGGPNHVALAPRSVVQITAGSPAVHHSTADSGAAVARAFCGACGTPLWSDTPNLPFRAIRVGSLDDPSAMRPAMHVWAGAAQPWHHFEAGAAVFEAAALTAP